MWTNLYLNFMSSSEIIRIRKGLDIKLQGKADRNFIQVEKASLYALKPTDFTGIVPKILVKTGDLVRTGTPLFYDKNHPEVKFTAPVSGKIADITRGERRRILAIVIESDGKDNSLEFIKADPSVLSRDQIRQNLLESGMWPVIRQRPYSVIANPADDPKAIFISGFDTAPLAPEIDFLVKDSLDELQKGLDALKKLTTGKIHISLNGDKPDSGIFSVLKGVEIHKFAGPHPAGNVGVHIHNIDPLNKGEKVWFVNPVDIVRIGKLFITGRPDNNSVIAVVGSEIKNPGYCKILKGSSITPLIKNNIKEGELRYISGNVLTGTKIEKDGYIGFYDYQLSVIPEGFYYDFLGWALPGLKKYSVSRSFFSWLHKGKEYRLDTNLKGGRRAFVMTGEYEKVFPMNIYPVQLVKAILAEDIDKMEKLGIYEVAEEDFALCEFVCTSKTDLQSVIRKGLDLMRKEME